MNGYDDVGRVPSPGHAIVLSAVSMPTRALQANKVDTVSTLWFAKDGLVVSTDVEVALSVADDWRDRVTLGWGQPTDRRFTSITVPVCANARGSHRWLVWTGGYFATEPVCAGIDLRVGTNAVRAWVGIGTGC